jgi:hypothetical protein
MSFLSSMATMGVAPSADAAAVLDLAAVTVAHVVPGVRSYRDY